MNDLTPDVSVSALSTGRAESFARLAAAKSGETLTPEQKTEFAKAARGFESMFVQMMMKQMKEAQLDEDESDKEDGMMSFGADTLQGYADMQFSDYVAKSGKGIGIADQLYGMLTGGEKLTAISQMTAAQESHSVLPVQENIQPLKKSSPLGQANESIQKSPAIAGGLGTSNSIAERLNRLDPIIRSAAEKNGIAPELIRAVVRAESAGRHDAVSPAGAKGLMQLMDGTAAGLGVRNPFDPQQNIEGGAQYLRQMLDTFGGNTELALAAYNAGPGNVRKHGGIPPFAETQQYVHRVMKYMRQDNLQ